jgi:hypothetical protein
VTKIETEEDAKNSLLKVSIQIAQKIIAIYVDFIDRNHLITSADKISVSSEVIVQAVTHSIEHIEIYRMPPKVSIFKVAGCFAHWISYLKPFRDRIDKIKNCKYHEFVNEAFAINFAYLLISNEKKYPLSLRAMTPHFYVDYIDELRYGDISPFSLALIFESVTYQSHPPLFPKKNCFPDKFVDHEATPCGSCGQTL